MRRTAAAAAETRRQVIDAATLAFAERGWDGATVEHIASRIAMTRGAVHHHFRGGKEELLGAVLTEQWERYGDVVLAPLGAPDQQPVRRLESFLVGYLTLLSDDGTFRALAAVTNLVAPMVGGRIDAVDEHRRSLDTWRAALHDVVEPPARLRPGVTADSAVFLLVAVVQGVNDTAALEPERLPGTDDERRAVARATGGGLLMDATPDDLPG